MERKLNPTNALILVFALIFLVIGFIAVSTMKQKKDVTPDSGEAPVSTKPHKEPLTWESAGEGLGKRAVKLGSGFIKGAREAAQEKKDKDSAGSKE